MPPTSTGLHRARDAARVRRGGGARPARAVDDGGRVRAEPGFPAAHDPALTGRPAELSGSAMGKTVAALDVGLRLLQGFSASERDAGWSSLVARRAHNPKVACSNHAPATLARNGSSWNKPGAAVLLFGHEHQGENGRAGEVDAVRLRLK